MCRPGEAIARISAHGLSPDEFVKRYVAENTPVILQDALGDETCRARAWTPQSLEELAPPGARVRVAPLMADGRDKWIEPAELWPGLAEADPLPGVLRTDVVLAVAASRIEVPVSEFTASLQGRGSLPSLYADGASNLDHSFSFLSEDLPAPPTVGQSLQMRRTDLWLGSRTLSTLHFDNYENLFAQLVGEKEFVLCPPGDSANLVDGRLRKAYATWLPRQEEEEGGSSGSGSGPNHGKFQRTADGLSSEAVLNYAAYDIDDPPPEYAARASKLRRTVVRVREGEVLYLPFGWWHQVRAVPGDNGLCASAAFFFEPFFVRLQPRASGRLGQLLPNPKYRDLCSRLGLDESDDEEAAPEASRSAGAGGESAVAT